MVRKCKVVFIGDHAAGKSSIINRFVSNIFQDTHSPTIGIDFISKTCIGDGEAVRLQFWDTAPE